MSFRFLSVLALCTSIVSSAPAATPTNPFPVADGFPTPNAAQIENIERGAHGTLPNGGPPKLHPDTYKSLQLIATNEQIEVSLYETCLLKLKAGSSGFGPENFVNDEHRAFVIATFEIFYQQEEIHALIGQGGLQANGQQPVKPSQYKLNTETYQDCLKTATIIGDNVLGTSQGVINQAIAAGDPGLAAQLDSLIAQEGQQSGFLRSETLVKGKHSRVPAAMPAYTASTREWLFSLLEQKYIKPGTDTNEIPLPVKFPMSVLDTNIQPVDQTLQFKVNLKPKSGNNYAFPNTYWNTKGLYVTYITGQNVPLSVPLQNAAVSNNHLTFSASFPAYTNIIHAFAIAALTPGNNYTTFQEASDASYAGPATIELVD